MYFGVQQFTLSSGQTFRPPLPGICVLVGPNNAGKSQLLRDLNMHVVGQAPRFLTDVVYGCNATELELDGWFEARSRPSQMGTPPQVMDVVTFTGSVLGNTMLDRYAFGQSWETLDGTRQSSAVVPRFIKYLDAEGRLATTNPAAAREVSNEALEPMHVLWDDADFEARLSEYVRRAFGLPVSINRASQSVALLIGPPVLEMTLPPDPQVLDDLLRRRPLDAQNVGDGVRSFAGTLLNVGSGRQNMYLIDEPEAFLHPPQARALGQALAAYRPSPRLPCT